MLHAPGSKFEPVSSRCHSEIELLSITNGARNASEAYSLVVNSSGAKLQADGAAGVLHGLETFTQLFYQHSSGEFWYTNIAPVAIQDSPAFPHRGLIFDISRMWYTVDEIKHTIGALAMAKMNKVHIIATNTQSWLLEVAGYPELTTKGTFYKGQYYSKADIHDIVTYGVSRGVEVILEIDMPGHSSIQKVYPDFGVAYMAQPYNKYCSEPPCGSFRLNNANVDKFLEDVFEDLLPRISPYATHFHTGGDEYNPNNCALDLAIGAAIRQLYSP